MSSDNHKRPSGEAITNPPGYLATQDLRERGWNPRLITQFLGEHDLTRPNGLRMGRRKLPPVKLYLERRVEAAENDEEFLVLLQRVQDRRERVQQRRAEQQRERAEKMQHLAEQYHPQVSALPLRKGAVRQARAPYLGELEATVARAAQQLNLSAAEQKELRRLLTAQLNAALCRVYPWFPSPQALPAARQTAQARPADWQSWEWD